ncbi:unnamed protein product [Alopecurus aequalis]
MTMGARLAVAVVFVAAIAAARQGHGRLHEHVKPVGNGTGTGKCHYQLDVRTEDVFLAGTDSTIYFDLYSKDNAVISTSMYGFQDSTTFERGTTTTIPLDTWCIRPCRLNITLDDLVSFASWRCESVRVFVSGDVKADVTFDVRKWIGPEEGDDGMTVTVDNCGGKPAS